MYRQNKLKEEIDRLRKELDNLKEENCNFRNEITFWKERCNTLNAEVLRYAIQNKDLMGRLIMKETLDPKIIKLDNEVEE